MNLYEPPTEHAGDGDRPCLFLSCLLPPGLRDVPRGERDDPPDEERLLVFEPVRRRPVVLSRRPFVESVRPKA